jgi:hypothetical protein
MLLYGVFSLVDPNYIAWPFEDDFSCFGSPRQPATESSV